MYDAERYMLAQDVANAQAAWISSIKLVVIAAYLYT